MNVCAARFCGSFERNARRIYMRKLTPTDKVSSAA
jgi:hypothetical protein